MAITPHIFLATQRRFVFLATQRRFVFLAKGNGMIGIFAKDPAEAYPIWINMTGAYPSGRTLLAATFAVTDVTMNEADNTVLRGTSAQPSGELIRIDVQGGVDQHRYKIVATVMDNAGGRYRETLLMLVRND